MAPGEILDQSFLRLAKERLTLAIGFVDDTLATDRDGAGWGHLSVAGNEMRAALAWLVSIGRDPRDLPQNDLAYEQAESGNEVTA